MSKLAAEIMAGRHDDDLTTIAKALAERLTADTVDAHWVGKIGDDTFTRSDLTFGALRRFEQATGKNVNRVDVLDMSATDQAVLAACWRWANNGKDWEKALDEVDAMRADDIDFDILIEPTPPKDV